MAVGLVFLLAACALKTAPIDEPPAQATIAPDIRLRLAATTFKKIPGWISDNHAEALTVFLKSCEKLRALPPTRKMGPKVAPIVAGQWLKVCTTAARVRSGSKIEAQYFFESHFTPYRASNYSNPVGLFTGYYEPELRGAWRPNATYRFPIYGRPKDLVSIDLGAFAMNGGAGIWPGGFPETS